MRLFLTLIATLAASAASAHPGHLIEAAGHNHWVAGAALGLAGALGIWQAIKGRKKAAKPAPEAEKESA